MTKNIVEKTKKNKVIEANVDGKNNFLIYIGIFLILVGVIGLSIILFNDKKMTDNQKFKEEYESLNDKTKNGVKYPEVKINPTNIEYIDSDRALEILEKETGVIYFGFPECPWCRNLVPVLLEASDEVGIDKIYYLNNLDERDTKQLENNKIVTEKEGTNDYYKLVEALKDFLWNYDGLNDNSIKRIYYPMVVFVKEGKILSTHIDTVESQDNPYKSLTKEQHDELFDDIVSKMFKTISCDDAC